MDSKQGLDHGDSNSSNGSEQGDSSNSDQELTGELGGEAWLPQRIVLGQTRSREDILQALQRPAPAPPPRSRKKRRITNQSSTKLSKSEKKRQQAYYDHSYVSSLPVGHTHEVLN